MASGLSSDYDKPAGFSLTDPRSWPSLYLMIVFLPLCLIIQLFSFIKISPIVCFLSTSILLFAIIIKLQVILNDRREYHKIFDRGNIPSVGNKSLLSGNMFEVIKPPNNSKIIDSYHKKLGKTFGLFYGPDPWIFTIDLDLLHKIFIKDRLYDRTNFRTPFPSEFQDSLAQIKGEKWRKTRRILNAPFTMHQMRSDNVFADIDAIVDKLMICFEEHPIEDGMSRLVDVNYNFKKFTLEVVFRIIYGRANFINFEAKGRDPIIDAVDECSKLIASPVVWASVILDDSSNFLGKFVRFTPMGKFIKLIHNVLDETWRVRGEQVRNDPDGIGAKRMIDSFIDCVQANKLDKEELKSNLFFMLLAGFETTANTLTMLFWELVVYPEAQDKLREAVLRDGEKAEYLAWCIHETLRLYPAVPIGTGRILPETIHFNGQTLFKGSTVHINTRSIHRSTEYWGEDAEKFRPERFGEMTESHPLRFFAFGHGPRRCIGGSLVMAELNALVPRIILKYRIERCSSTPEVLDPPSPNLIHMIIDGCVNFKFTEISSL